MASSTEVLHDLTVDSVVRDKITRKICLWYLCMSVHNIYNIVHFKMRHYLLHGNPTRRCHEVASCRKIWVLLIRKFGLLAEL